MHRFSDKGTYNESFQSEIAVVCPKCKKQARVIADGSRWTAKNIKVVCNSCGFHDSNKNGSWYGPTVGVIKRRCYQSGRWLNKTIKGPKHSYEQKLTCPGCKCEMIENIIWYKSSSIGACDPYFGLKLWFVGNIKGNEFWAYNREHLEFINNYVHAKIRIREPNKNSSLTSRLPNWLLSSKNRQTVLKEINRMQKKSS